MSSSVESDSTFEILSNRIAQELAHYLNTTTVEINSLVANWRTLGSQNGSTAQDKALDEVLEYLDPSATYADDDGDLREYIESVLSDVLDTMLPDPEATPSPEDSQKDSGDDDELKEDNE